MPKNKTQLSEDQKKFILQNADKMDLLEITRVVFDNQELDGRTAEGRVVRKFLADRNIDYSTSKHQKVPDVELTEEQQEFILNHGKTMKAMDMTRTLFQDNTIKPLDKRFKVVNEYLKSIHPSVVGSRDEEVSGDEYQPPNTFKRGLKKVNEVTGQNLDEDHLNNKVKKGIEKLIVYLHSPRYLDYIRQLTSQSEVNLFEAEFIRSSWDKPDLTADEINLTINLCQEYIMQNRIYRTINSLTAILEGITQDEDSGGKASMSLVESIKNQREDLHKSIDRQRKINDDINGSRKARIAQKTVNNKSIAAIVEALQEEEERKTWLEHAKRRQAEVSDEVKRMESLPESIARIFGLDDEEIIYG